MSSPEKAPVQTSDTVLVRIAQRPFLVAGLFLFTALFPWLIYFSLPLLIRAVHSASVIDFFNWLPAPLLFFLVNSVLFFLWMNYSKSSGTSRPALIPDIPDITQGEGWEVLDETETLKKQAGTHLAGADTGVEYYPTQDIDHVDGQISSCSSSSCSSSESGGEDERERIIPELDHARRREKMVTQEEPTLSNTAIIKNSTHKKSQSLRGNLKLDLTDLPSGRVTRRNSSPKPKSKTPTSSDMRPVTRRNSTPKSITPSAASMSSSRFERGRNNTLPPDCSYTPPLRGRPDPMPVPLDRDDLNARIDTFLTKFKIKRQESNLKAALTSQ